MESTDGEYSAVRMGICFCGCAGECIVLVVVLVNVSFCGSVVFIRVVIVVVLVTV